MKIRAGKFTSAVKVATKSIQNALTPPSPPPGMRGFYSRPSQPALLGLSRIPTLKANYESGTLEKVDQPEWENVDEDVLDKVSVLKYDITRLKVDAIVNAANRSLLGGGGVDGAIHRAAGSGLLDECRRLKGCDVGEAKITRGHKLAAAYIIHTVGPIYDDYRSEKDAANLLKDCYTNSLKLAVEKNLRTIAFCSISTGVYGYPIEAATKEAMIATRSFLDSEEGKQIDRVIFCTFSPSDTMVYQQLASSYFPTSKEYPAAAERDTLPEVPFGAELPTQSSTPGDDSDALTEDEVLVPRTPNRKASTRLKHKATDDDGDFDTKAVSQAAMDVDSQPPAGADPDPATVVPSQESQVSETKEAGAKESEAAESSEAADAATKESKEPTLYDTEVVDGVKLDGPSTLPTTVALNVPGPSEPKSEEATTEASAATPEDPPKAKTEEELVKEQELAQANAVPAAGPPPPAPEEDKTEPPAAGPSEEAEKKVEEPKAEEKQEEAPKVEESKEVESKAAEETGAEVKEPEAKAADKVPEAKTEESKATEPEAPKAESAKSPEDQADAKKDEEKKDESWVVVPDSETAAASAEPAPAAAPEQPKE